MKSIDTRELASVIPHLRETLTQEQELLLVCDGEPLARILPIARKRDVAPMAAHRATMSALAQGVLASLVRDERDRA